jgi:hypothetical protein
MPAPTHRERMRAVALASKLGAMAEEYDLLKTEEEAFLTFAVEEMLRVVREVGGEPSSFVNKVFGTSVKNSPGSEDAAIVLSNLELPTWVSTTDVGAPMEALASFYSRTERYEYESDHLGDVMIFDMHSQLCYAVISASYFVINTSSPQEVTSGGSVQR